MDKRRKIANTQNLSVVGLETFKKIVDLATDIAIYAATATTFQKVEERDRAMEWIIKKTEAIEKLYSENWH